MLAVTPTVKDGFAPKPLEPSLDWVSLLYALIALIGVCVVGFKNAKRTHLD